MEHAKGLAWQLWDYAGQRAIPVTGKMEAHAEWTLGEAGFVVPRNAPLVRLGLGYQRASGSTRIRGTVVLAGFRLRLKKS
jgi:hypothetical protein